MKFLISTVLGIIAVACGSDYSTTPELEVETQSCPEPETAVLNIFESTMISNTCTEAEEVFTMPVSRVFVGSQNIFGGRGNFDPQLWFEGCVTQRNVSRDGAYCRHRVQCFAEIGWVPHVRSYQITRAFLYDPRQHAKAHSFSVLLDWVYGHCAVDYDVKLD